VELQFDRGKTISGSVVDPDGKPATGVVAHGLAAIFVRPQTLADGKFTAAALDPRRPRTVVFVDAARKLCGDVCLTGNEKSPPVVRLQRWITATGQVFDSDGRWCPDVTVLPSIHRPGINLYSGYRFAVEGIEGKTDSRGRFRFELPLANVDFGIAFVRNGRPVWSAKGITVGSVRPGETLNFGDITIRKE
jgi:hypothetical protein